MERVDEEVRTWWMDAIQNNIEHPLQAVWDSTAALFIGKLYKRLNVLLLRLPSSPPGWRAERLASGWTVCWPSEREQKAEAAEEGRPAARPQWRPADCLFRCSDRRPQVYRNTRTMRQYHVWAIVHLRKDYREMVTAFPFSNRNK